MINNVIDAAKSLNCEYDVDVPMSTKTSFKTGGKADLMLYPDSVDALLKLLEECKNNNLKTYIIGNGSNILVSDNGLSGVVFRLSNNMSEIKLIDDDTIYCQCGVSMQKLCSFALEHSLSGLEFAYGIPGTAGGAAYMNAGAYGGEMKDVLYRCDHIDEHGKIGFFENDELELSYRKSVYSNKNYIITALYMKLKKGDYDEIKALMNENLSKRRDKQPLEYPSAGSTFKRPEGYFAGRLIEDCGLKGYSVGDAQVSEKHAGFVINKGNATSTEIHELINHIRDTVLEKTGVLLEPEVKFFD